MDEIKALFYDPPYERQLEDELAWYLVKYVRPVSLLEYRYRTEQGEGIEWLDFRLATAAGKRVGFQIGQTDGAGLDAARIHNNQLTSASGEVDVIYHITATALLHCPHDALYVIGELDPDMFTSRGIKNLNVLASEEAKRALKISDGPLYRWSKAFLGEHKEMAVHRCFVGSSRTT